MPDKRSDNRRFQKCPKCGSQGFLFGVDIFKCPSCNRLCCSNCLTGWINDYCPSCTGGIVRKKDKRGNT